MVGPSTLVPNLSEIMEEYTQPEGEVRQELERENLSSEPSEVQPVSKQQRKKGKKNRKKKRKTNSYKKKLSPSGRSTMPVRGLSDKEASANSSPLSRN